MDTGDSREQSSEGTTARAIEKSQSNDEEIVRTDQNQYVVFELQSQIFGIDIQKVKEVQKLKQVTDVFHTPSFVVGVVNIRGDVVALLDIGLFFGMGSTDWDDEKRMIITQYQSRDAGLLADTMKGVQWVDESKIEDPPSVVEGVSSDWIEGVIQRDGEPLIILDMESIFNSKRVEDL